jgi:hypothetical protein
MKQFLKIKGLFLVPLGANELCQQGLSPDLVLMEINQGTNHDPEDRQCPQTEENLFYEFEVIQFFAWFQGAKI